MEAGPTPVTEDYPRTEQSDVLAPRDTRSSATARTEELALISKELADANILISKELANANILLAEKTQASAELLAKTTQRSAELLATITQASADELRRSNDVATKLMNRLTVIMVIIALIQLGVAAIALFALPH